MNEITIYKKSIPVPNLSGAEFQEIQERIRARHEMIQQGKRVEKLKQAQTQIRSFWDKLIKDREFEFPRRIDSFVPLDIEERFQEMQALSQDYERMLSTLKTQKASYDRFFHQMAHEVRLAVLDKCGKFMEIERERELLETQAQADGDDVLAEVVRGQRDRLLGSVRLLARAALLLLKKLELFEKSLNRLAEDQDVQKQVLARMVKRVEQHYRAYKLQKKIDQLESEVAEMANVAVHFEEYMREYLGPFQHLLSEVTKIDKTLVGTVDEIRELTKSIVQEQSGTLTSVASGETEERLLEFLIRGDLKQTRLAEAFAQVSWEDASSELFELELAECGSEPASVQSALENIQTLLDIRLPQPSPSEGFSGLEDEFDFEVVTVDVYGRETGRRPSKARRFVEEVGNGVQLEMVYIPGGTFLMGASQHEKERQDSEGPQHSVTLPSFYMSRYPVTQTQWKAIMGNNPSNCKGANRPVEQVSWDDAIEFCEKLTEETDREYRLPSEAQWEYACRAGTMTPFYFGETLIPDLANYNGNSTYASGQKGIFRNKTSDVESFPPNAFGLSDMHGNVWEWCEDFWHGNYHDAPTDGSVWKSGGDTAHKVLRGGSWLSIPGYCRCAFRRRNLSASRNSHGGFRVVLCSLSWVSS